MFGLYLQPVSRETEVIAEDEQAFLARQMQMLQETQGQMRSESPLRSQQGKASPKTPLSAGSQSSPKKVRFFDCLCV